MINYSIIIPHFSNGTTTLLERAVASIPERGDIEVLVIDNSLRKIEKDLFQVRKNVIILYSDNAKRAGGARNVGLDNAKGKWILFLDADDFLLPLTFDFCDEYLGSGYDIIFFKMTSCYSDTLYPANRHEPYAKSIEKCCSTNDFSALRYQYSSPCAKMIRKSIVDQNYLRYDEMYCAEDVGFNLQIGLKANAVCADLREIYCATVTQGSLTNEISLQSVKATLESELRRNQLLKQNNLKQYRGSHMHTLLLSARFGFKIFFKCVSKVVQSGDLFVGWTRWFGTSLKLLLKQNNNQYKVKK